MPIIYSVFYGINRKTSLTSENMDVKTNNSAVIKILLIDKVHLLILLYHALIGALLHHR